MFDIEYIQKIIAAFKQNRPELMNKIRELIKSDDSAAKREAILKKTIRDLEKCIKEKKSELEEADIKLRLEINKSKKTREELTKQSVELVGALSEAGRAKITAEKERDKSKVVVERMEESQRRLEILISDAVAREKRMVELKREVNMLHVEMGRPPRYKAPDEVDAFLKTSGAMNDDGADNGL